MTDYQHIEVSITVDGDHFASFTVNRQIGEGTAVVTYHENEHAPAPRHIKRLTAFAPMTPMDANLAASGMLRDILSARVVREPLPLADDGSVTA